MMVRTPVAAVLAGLAGLAAFPARGTAQRPAPEPNTASSGPYERARRLVEQGAGPLGRALTDSLVAASPPGSPALAEALWWRATLSADAARAEQDLRRVVTEFPNSPRAGDAAVRLAQLDLARDRADVAAFDLARLVREHPDDPARAQAAYWLARARFDTGDAHGGCLALADAAVWARSSETVLRQDIGELRRRTPACDPTSAVTAMVPGTQPPPALEQLGAAAQRAEAQREAARQATQAAAAPATPPATTAVVRDSTNPGFTITPATPRATASKAIQFEQKAPQKTPPRTTTTAATKPAPKPVAVASASPSAPAPTSVAPSGTNAAPTPAGAPTGTAVTGTTATGTATPTSAPASVTAAVRTPAPTAAPTSAPAPTTTASTTPPAVAPPAKAPAPASPAAPPPAALADANAAGAFSVQIAAYNQREPADALAARLKTRGLDARVTGSVAPFRVKLGHYPTRAAAAAARTTFAGQGFAGFVTDAGDGPRRP